MTDNELEDTLARHACEQLRAVAETAIEDLIEKIELGEMALTVDLGMVPTAIHRALAVVRARP